MLLSSFLDNLFVNACFDYFRFVFDAFFKFNALKVMFVTFEATNLCDSNSVPFKR